MGLDTEEVYLNDDLDLCFFLITDTDPNSGSGSHPAPVCFLLNNSLKFAKEKKIISFFYRYPVPDPDLGWPYNADLDMKLWS